MYMLKYFDAVGTLIPIYLAAAESVIRPLQNASNASKNFLLLMVFTPFAIANTAFRFQSNNRDNLCVSDRQKGVHPICHRHFLNSSGIHATNTLFWCDQTS
nr:MAG TPA: hypothetical protein [Caudoviricetes sp.]